MAVLATKEIMLGTCCLHVPPHTTCTGSSGSVPAAGEAVPQLTISLADEFGNSVLGTADGLEAGLTVFAVLPDGQRSKRPTAAS